MVSILSVEQRRTALHARGLSLPHRHDLFDRRIDSLLSRPLHTERGHRVVAVPIRLGLAHGDDHVDELTAGDDALLAVHAGLFSVTLTRRNRRGPPSHFQTV